MKGLTEKQARMLAEIERACADGLPPTVRELCRVFRVRNRAIQERIEALGLQGRIEGEPKRARAIRVLVPLTSDERARFRLDVPTRPQLPVWVFKPAERCDEHEITTVGVPCPYCAGLRRVG